MLQQVMQFFYEILRGFDWVFPFPRVFGDLASELNKVVATYPRQCYSTLVSNLIPR